MLVAALWTRRYGDVLPRSIAGKLLIALTSCCVKLTTALLYALMIRANAFSPMEARIHSFLYRMDLHVKKELNAVRAVQATFRFNKTYRKSVRWHQHDHTSSLYYRPLSAVRA